MNAWPRRGTLITILACGLCLVAAAASPAKRIGVIAPALETPDNVIPWAKPLDGKAFHVLFIAPRGAMRDADELEARLECELSRVALPARDTGLHAATPAIVEAKDAADVAPAVEEKKDAPAAPKQDAAWIDALRKALDEHPDVIVLGNLEVPGLPEDLQRVIVSLVNDGAGLLLSNVLLKGGPIDTFLAELGASDAGKAIVAGAAPVPLQGEKPISGYVHALETDKARAVVIDGPGDPPLTQALLPPPPDGIYLEEAWREDAWSLILRALRWVAKREPEAAITAMTDTSPKGPNEEEIPPDLPREFVQSMRDSAFNLPLHPVSVQLSAPAPRAVEAVFQLRRRGEAKAAYSTTTRVAKGAQQFSTQLLINPGEFEVDCLLRGHKGNADWWTMNVSVQGWPEAEDLHADKTFLLPNDAVTITAKVRGVFGAARVGAVYARALDPDGALLGEATVPVDSNGGAVQIKMAFADLLTSMVVIEVYAFEGAARRYSRVELDSTGAQILRFPVRQLRRAPRFELVAAAPPQDEFNARWYLGQWRDSGVKSIYTSGGNTAVVRAAELGLALVPALAECAPATRENVNKPCLSDPAYLEKERTRIAEDMPLYWAGGGGAYGLGWPAYLSDPKGDENPCQSDTCVKAYHAWLQRHYPDVSALNASWGAAWPSFDEIAPPDLSACKQADAPAPWMNWRACMDETFAASLSSARTAAQGIDHTSAAGIATIEDADARHGYDWPRLSTTVDFIVAPPTQCAAEKIRSYRRQATWGGIASPTLESEAQGHWLAWHALFEQMPSVWIQDALPSALKANERSAFTADNELASPYAALAEAVEEIQDGPGPIILAAARAQSGIAVIDSRPSRLAAEVDTQFGPYLAAQEAWVALLRREGFEFAFVTPSQAAAGGLEPYRVAIMPLALALDVEEAAGIARFAQQGGALLADIAPGAYTALGARTEAPLLDDWFGVKHEGRSVAHETPLENQNVLSDSATRAAGAEAKIPGDAPSHFLVDKEKHHALLLNYVPKNDAGPWDGPVREFLLANGCARAVELAGDGKNVHYITRAHFHYGQAEVLALLAAPDAPGKVEARVVLSEAQHVYNLTTGEPVERPKKTTVRLGPGEAAVLALLPYEVTELRVEAPGIVEQGKRLSVRCQVRVRKGQPGKHLIRVTLAAPGGDVIPRYTQYIEAEGGAGEGYVPVLLGQTPGIYTLRADDLLSGVSFQREVKLVGLSIQ